MTVIMTLRPALICLALCLMTLITSPAKALMPRDEPIPTLEKIADGVWVHKSYKKMPALGMVLSQGLVIDNGTDVFLVDTAWNETDTRLIITLTREVTGKTPRYAIMTHAHADKMGGVAALRKAGVESYALDLSNKLAPANDLLPADHDLSSTTGAPVSLPGVTNGPVVFYPGVGHTHDNAVVYYAPAKILFGGCLIRPGENDDMGNTADGDVTTWAATVRKAASAFPDATIIVPSHGATGTRALLDHTISLADSAAETAKKGE